MWNVTVPDTATCEHYTALQAKQRASHSNFYVQSGQRRFARGPNWHPCTKNYRRSPHGYTARRPPCRIPDPTSLPV